MAVNFEVGEIVEIELTPYQTGDGTWVPEQTLIRLLEATTDSGIVCRQDDYGVVFFPWHRVLWIRADDTLKNREAK